MKKICLYIMTILLLVCLTGCGEDSSSELNQEELVYDYEMLTCDGIEGEVKNFVATNEDLYFYTGEYTEPESMGEEMVKAHFYKCKLDGSELKELPIEWNLEEFEWLHAMEASGDGKLWLLYSAYSEEKMIDTYLLRLVEDSGKIIKEIDINDYIDVEDFFVTEIKEDAENYLYINTGYSVLIFDSEGNVTGNVEAEDFIEDLIRAKDGSVLAGFGYEQGYTLKKIDPMKANFLETYKTGLPFYEIFIGMDGEGYDFYYQKGDSLYGYDLVTGGETEIISFIASTLNTNYLGKMQILSENRILAIYGITDAIDPFGLYLFQKKDPKEVKIKKIVTYASPYADTEAKERAILFNRSQDKYLVVLKDYQYSENPEMELYKDLQSGERVDIVDFSGLQSEKYIAQEMFVDLYKFMKWDKEIKKEYFVDNMLSIMETDGKLYHITPSVGLNVVTAKASDIKTGVPLTLQRLTEMEGEAAKAFYRETKMSFLTNALEYNYESYVNWKEGTCYFDSEEFKVLLKYANTYEEDDTDMWAEESESLTSKIRSGDILFAGALSATPEELQLFEEMYEEDIVWIGYPSEQYTGAAMSMNRDFAICASSNDKKGAWEFLKTFLSREYVTGQTGDTISIPIRKDSLEDKLMRYTAKEEYVDEFGNKILPLSYEWGYEELEIDVKPLSAKQEALYRDTIYQMDHRYVYDYDMVTMVSEEVEPYFAGDISAEEAAANLQERVSVYMEDYIVKDKE